MVLSPDQIIHLEQLPVIFSDLLRKQHNASDQTVDSGLRHQRDQQIGKVEVDLMIHYLREAGGNVSAAARLADIPRRTFYRMLERHSIDCQDYRTKS